MNGLIEKAYLLVQWGPEGIDQIWHLTDDEQEIVNKFKEISGHAIKQDRELWKDDLKRHRALRDAEILDQFCIYKWQHGTLQCACNELGIDKIGTIQP